jgi:CHASE3 domain sensor protein
MIGKMQKAVLLIAFPALLILIGMAAYSAGKSLGRVRDAATQRLEASLLQGDISRVLIDIGDIETGAQAYLLTADTSYLDPYAATNSRLGGDFASLRSRLETRSPEERTLEARVEELVRARQAEAEQTIHWRQQGYRHRAFVLVNQGRGKAYTEEARKALASLSASAAESFAKYDADTKSTLDRALIVSRKASLGLFALVVLLFALFIFYTRRLEREVRETATGLRGVQSRLERFRSAVSRDLRERLSGIQEYAEFLLAEYGDFLPLQGQQYTERMKEMAGETKGTVESVLADAESEREDKALGRAA